jgi:hypothetical protein
MPAPPIVQYKVLAYSQRWGNRGLTEKASAELNELARFGWRVEHFAHGWNGFLMATLYVLLRRDIPAEDEGQPAGAG